MKATELISELRAALVGVKAQGQLTIPIEGLENYLADAEKIANANQEKQAEITQLDEAHAKFQHDFEVWKINAPLKNAADQEMFKSVIEAGQTALKSAILINGGAAVALLAFLGNLLTKEAPKGIAVPIPVMGHAMLIFIMGVGLAGLASGFRYLCQWLYSSDWNRTGDAFNYSAIVLGLASFAAFFWGGIEAYHAMLPI